MKFFFELFWKFFENSLNFFCSLMECVAKKTGWSSAVVCLDLHGAVFGRLKRSDSARWCWSCANVIRLKFLAWFPYGLVRCRALALVSLIIFLNFSTGTVWSRSFHRAIWTSLGSPSQIAFSYEFFCGTFWMYFSFLFLLSIFEQNAIAKGRVWCPKFDVQSLMWKVWCEKCHRPVNVR